MNQIMIWGYAVLILLQRFERTWLKLSDAVMMQAYA